MPSAASVVDDRALLSGTTTMYEDQDPSLQGITGVRPDTVNRVRVVQPILLKGNRGKGINMREEGVSVFGE
ncbi:hypothetical protein FNV43_RR22382 [Rhamnella rubrinervis]|uniref:Uncharacterized protein n=1 Tax=Rhamnella rubrinervis TaxID=2594499 RepID=A0A8K0GV56_9ROSA|nr:hypothetical protein FNV43_RR22382 [Rhamnella rubrinervis]